MSDDTHPMKVQRPDSQTLSTLEAAAKLNLTMNQVRHRFRRGTLDGYRAENGTFRITAESVERHRDRIVKDQLERSYRP